MERLRTKQSGNIASDRSEYDDAERLYRACLLLMQVVNDRQGEAGALNNLANILGLEENMTNKEICILKA